MKVTSSVISRAFIPIALSCCLSAVADTSDTVAVDSEQAIHTSSPGVKIVGSAEKFSGHVVVDMLYSADGETQASVGLVEFAPGAHSNWHSHPAGQYLIVTQGEGWVQEWNGEKQLIKAGNVVWTPPLVKHWHGATESKSMSHYAIQNAIKGETVHWLEKVSE